MRVVILILLFFLNPLLSSGEVQNHPHRRSWINRSEDSLIWNLADALVLKYNLSVPKPIVGAPPKLDPDSLARLEGSKGSYNNFRGVEILSDSATKKFGLIVGMTSSAFKALLGVPDRESTYSPKITSLTYILYNEWSHDEIIFYFESDHFIRIRYLSGLWR